MASIATLFTIGHSTRTADELIALLRAHRVTQLADVRAIPASRRLPHFAADALAASLRQAGIGYRHHPALGGRRRPRADSINNAWQHPAFRGYADYMQTPAFARAIDELMAYAAAAPAALTLGAAAPAAAAAGGAATDGADIDGPDTGGADTEGADTAASAVTVAVTGRAEAAASATAAGATAIMCAEALWWQCHRRLVADALVVRGVVVRHIMTATAAEPHELTPFARVDAAGQTLTYPGLLDQTG